MAEHFTIDTISREQIDFAVELAANEGWNPGLHDGCGLFYSGDPTDIDLNGIFGITTFELG